MYLYIIISLSLIFFCFRSVNQRSVNDWADEEILQLKFQGNHHLALHPLQLTEIEGEARLPN